MVNCTFIFIMHIKIAEFIPLCCIEVICHYSDQVGINFDEAEISVAN